MEPRLLPPSFKMISLAFVGVSVLTLVVLRIANPSFIHEHRLCIEQWFPNLMILALLFFALARDRKEDERTILLRLKAITLSFILGAFAVISEPLVSKIFNDTTGILSSRHLILEMLIVYVLIFRAFKKWN